MRPTLTTPDFKCEKEEAEWYDKNQDALFTQFQEAAQAGTLTSGTLVRQTVTTKTSIRLDEADIELAKVQAKQRGLRYQTYLKMLIHQALRNETSGNERAQQS